MNHRKILISVFVAMTAFGSAQAQRVKGSDTLLPLTQELAEEYLEEHPDSSVIVTGGGSGVGISALMENTTDIAMASRRIKFGEKMKFAEAGLEAEEVIVAYDALAVVVNPSNPVSKLTREQLEAIFRGKITNWKEVGGEDRRIVVYSRETSSGTYEFFKESVLDNKNYMSSILSMPATGAIIQSVKQTKGAIGYIGLAYLNRYVKPLAVSYDGGEHYAVPSVETAADGSYPIVRPLYYYYDATKEQTVSSFISYALSPVGQKSVLEQGFVPVKMENATEETKSDGDTIAEKGVEAGENDNIKSVGASATVIDGGEAVQK